MSVTIQVRSTWSSIDTIEVPEDMTANEARDVLNRGHLPQWAADQVDASGADLVDWEAR